MGSGEWRSPPARVATNIPTGQKPFWPLADGKERVLECGEIRAVLVCSQPSRKEALFLMTKVFPTSVCLPSPHPPAPCLRLPGLS